MRSELPLGTISSHYRFERDPPCEQSERLPAFHAFRDFWDERAFIKSTHSRTAKLTTINKAADF
jgi:hypothetical protein